MGNQSVTIKDVARAAGVSITTVSRYLNQRYESMSQETRERIARVIDTLNYQPNKMAQGLKGQSRTVAAIVVNLGYPFAVSVIRTMSSVLGEAGYALLVGESGGDTDEEARLLQSFLAQGVDGIVLQTGGSNNDTLERIAKDKPVVLVDRQFDIAGVQNVITNNEEASKSLTQQLIEQGYHHVLFISEPPDGLSTRKERLNGYLAACQTKGVAADVRWVLHEDPSSISAIAAQIADHPPETPFAVYTANGLVMLQLYPLLTRLPFATPSEMGLATFDEPDWVQVTKPRLTCVRQPMDAIGKAAADAILRRLANRPAETTITGETAVGRSAADLISVIPSKVVWGESTDRGQ